MAVTIPKILALLIAVGYMIAAIVWADAGANEIVMLVLVLLLPLVLIWFPGIGTSWPRKKTILGNYTDPSTWRPHRDSHPGIVTFMGWLFLLGTPVLLYFLWN